MTQTSPTAQLHTLETAPEASKPLLERSQKEFGMIPNLHAVLAESPALLRAYQELHQRFQETSFNKEELTVVWQTINVEHGCHYCVPAHTLIANSMGVAPEITEALRQRKPMPDAKLQVLHETTLVMLRNRGHITEDEKQAFFDAGYGQVQLLEIILGLSQKVISNYVNHLAETPIDAPFKPYTWE